jgi:HEAT repeat protein
MKCCICGQDMGDLPAMQDRATGVVYCPNHSEYFYALKDPNAFSSCRCGFKFSSRLSRFPSGLCPVCGRALVRAEPAPETPTQLPALLSALRGARLKSPELLKHIQYPAAVDDLVYLLENEPDPTTLWAGLNLRINIVRSLGELGDARSIGSLANCYTLYLAYEEMLIEYWKERQLSVPDSYRDISDLIVKYGRRSLTDSSAYARYRAATAGTVIPLPDEFDVRLRTFAWEVRLSVVRALGRFKDAAIKNDLQQMLIRERHEAVRAEISLELGRLGDPQAIPGLAVLLKETRSASRRNPDLVIGALDILGNFSETHDEAFEAIADFYELCEGKAELRRHALAVLEQLPKRHLAVAEINQRVEQRQWRAEGRCELCGKNVGLRDRLRGITRCKEHQAAA